MAHQIQTLEGGCCPVVYRPTGIIETNVYVIEDGQGGVIVCDPASHADEILEMVGGRPVSAIFVTHRHFDHIGALKELHEATGAPVYASVQDTPGIVDPDATFGKQVPGCTVDVQLSDGDEVAVGALTWRFLHTPGHTEGSGCYLLEPSRSASGHGAPVLLSGDTLFRDAHGRVDFPGGSMPQMADSLARLGKLDGSTLVLPGHGETTTISAERNGVIAFFGSGS